MVQVGLDQYLTAKVYIRKEDWPASQPDPAPITLPGPIPGLTITAQKISPHRGEPIRNPRYTEVLEAAGLDPEKDWGYGVYVEVRAGYWRKANQIHAWFEREVADGNLENCRRYDVQREQLQELRDACQRVIDTVVWGEPVHHEADAFNPDGWDEPVILSLDTDLAHELLPTQSGFFYGNTDYDGWYVHDLQDTVEQLDRVLNDPGLLDAEFEYHAWW